MRGGTGSRAQMTAALTSMAASNRLWTPPRTEYPGCGHGRRGDHLPAASWFLRVRPRRRRNQGRTRVRGCLADRAGWPSPGRAVQQAQARPQPRPLSTRTCCHARATARVASSSTGSTGSRSQDGETSTTASAAHHDVDRNGLPDAPSAAGGFGAGFARRSCHAPRRNPCGGDAGSRPCAKRRPAGPPWTRWPRAGQRVASKTTHALYRLRAA